MMHSIPNVTLADALRCAFLPGLLLFVILCAFVNQKLREIAERRKLEAIAPRPGKYYRFYSPASFVHPKDHLIDSSNHTPPAGHAHEIIFSRSVLSRHPDGSMRATCAFQGCDAVIVIDSKALELIAMVHQ